jgi:anthraniloyl-CoA monooxygenase
MNNPKSKIQNPKFVVLGGGPAGLYCALLLKKANPAWEVEVIERNPPDVTYGWGVVFSDRTLSSFQRADYKSYTGITEQFVIWDAIDIRYRGEIIRCGGHVIAAIERRKLLDILQGRCAELGVMLSFGREITDPAQLPECDLLISADGVNSFARRVYEAEFQPSIEMGRAKYIWLGANKALDAFNFIFHETEHGLFQVHAYPFSGHMSTFIVECAEDVWLKAGLDKADETASLEYCQRLLNADLGGVPLLSNNSRWINFPTLKTRHWHTKIQSPKSKIQNYAVLLGDAAHTAHFSIGSGTKLAMEDAIALAEALEKHVDIGMALDEYELERRPVVETFQRAAHESQVYFETLKRYMVLPPMQFAFQLLTRSGRISYDDLHFRDAKFGDGLDAWFAWNGKVQALAEEHNLPLGSIEHAPQPPRFAPSPLFTLLRLRDVAIHNRLAGVAHLQARDLDGTPDVSPPAHALSREVGLVVVSNCAISSDGRVTPYDCGMYREEHGAAWSEYVEYAHEQAGMKVALQLSHAGRRGATEPRAWGLDRPLREGGWPLVAASARPYTAKSQTPKEMDRADMERVRDEFARAACMANEAGFDMLVLQFAHGYLLAGFLSPLANLRADEYGGDLDGRSRFPLEVFDAVRAAWPAGKPLAVSLNAEDNVKGGSTIKDAVELAKVLKARGCDLIHVLAGQSVPDGDMPYGRGFLTPLSDRIRNEAGIPTMVGGYLTTSNDANTVLAAGRADLCIMDGRR